MSDSKFDQERLTGSRTSASLEELMASVGKSLGASRWVLISQASIDAFANLTNDHYFLHVDKARAALTPFGGTIAHGFMTLSLIATMAYDVCPTINGESTILNYGFDKVRFITPVPSGARVRANFTLSDAKLVGPGRTQLIYKVTVEIEGQDRHALVANWIQLIVT